MRLVTFVSDDGLQRAGALVDGDRVVVDLDRAHGDIWGGSNPSLASVLALIEGGEAASELARTTIQRAPDSAKLTRQAVHLLAPLQPPPQMRDCSCFELHLKQSFASARRFRVRREPDPEAAYAALDTTADDKVIE